MEDRNKDIKIDKNIGNEKKKKTFIFKFGVGLLILYVLLWLSVIAIPFLPVSTFFKITVAPSIAIGAEIILVIAALCVGKEVISKYKKFLNPKNWKKGE